MFKAQIIGVGTDIVELARLEKSISRTGDAFLQKVYAPGELDALPAQERRRLEFLGGRWAAKEALAKALGTGVGEACRMNEVTVLNDGQGRPVMTLAGRTRETADSLGVSKIHLSISHERDYALAFVVLS